jgi:DnaJ-class molecular chaperone
MLADQGSVIIYQHVSKLELEASGTRAQANAECPQCKGKGRVPMHHGLRDKECPRCGGKGWVKAKP